MFSAVIPARERWLNVFGRSGLGRQFLGVAMNYAMLTKQSLWETLALARREALSVSANPGLLRLLREMQRVLGSGRRQIGDTRIGGGRRIPRHDGGSFPPSVAQTLETHRSGFARAAVRSHYRNLHDLSLTLLRPLRSSASVSVGQSTAARNCAFECRPICIASLRKIALWRARRSADVLPTDILQRGLGKGGPTLWAKEVIERNAGFLREFLLDGILVRQRLLDRKKLETVLSPRIAKSTVIAGDIVAKAYIEAWLRAWPPAETPACRISANVPADRHGRPSSEAGQRSGRGEHQGVSTVDCGTNSRSRLHRSYWSRLDGAVSASCFNQNRNQSS